MKWFKPILIHLLLWSVYVALEYLTNRIHYSPWEQHLLWRSIFIFLPLIILPTYFIAYFLVPQFLRRKQYIPFVFGLVFTAIVVLLGRINLLALMEYLEGSGFRYFPVSKILKNLIRDYSVIALAVCIKIIDDWRKKDALNKQLYRAKAEAEIKFLKAQLHPHFLFNTLNNIYGLSLRQSPHVPESILKLSQILDYLIYYSDKDQIPLNKEIELIKNYIELEKLRFGNKLKLEVKLPKLKDEIQTSPLILLPFVENAFKHSGKNGQGVIRIAIQLEVLEDKFVFTLENSKANSIAQEKRENGIGIRNLKERLAMLYPGRYDLKIEDGEQSYKVRLTVASESFQGTPRLATERLQGYRP